MKTYVQIRGECEALICESGLHANILRPWYILGPGHYWAIVLLPAFWLTEQLLKTRESAIRLGLVTVRQTINALIWAIEQPGSDDSGAGRREEPLYE